MIKRKTYYLRSSTINTDVSGVLLFGKIFISKGNISNSAINNMMFKFGIKWLTY